MKTISFSFGREGENLSSEFVASHLCNLPPNPTERSSQFPSRSQQRGAKGRNCNERCTIKVVANQLLPTNYRR